MFNVGGGEVIVILLLALLVLGPDKLPSTAKKVGKFLHEVRRMTSGFEQEVRKAMDFEHIDPDNSPTPSATGSQLASDGDDALHRTSDGPQLTGPGENSIAAPPASNPKNDSQASGLSAPFVVDLSGSDPVAGSD
jgi:Tat protein translocase TatB subunit